nr:MAG: hypothetical protein [Apis mellifra filamentous-like virus]
MLKYEEVLALTVDDYIRYAMPGYDRFLTDVIGVDMAYVREKLTWRANSPREPFIVLERILDLLGVPGQTYEIKYGVFRKFLQDEEFTTFQEIEQDGTLYIMMRTNVFEMAVMLMQTPEAFQLHNVLSVLRCADMKFLQCQALFIARIIGVTNLEKDGNDEEEEEEEEFV